MKPYYRGMLAGITLSALTVILYTYGLFGDPVSYNATYLRLENDNPSAFVQAIDTSVDFSLGDPENGVTPAPLSFYKAQTIADITDEQVEQVCIVRAVLDYDGAEDWLARIRLKDTSIFGNTAGELGFARWGNDPYDTSVIRLGLFKAPTSDDSVNQMPNHQTNDIYISFNEKDVPSTSILLLELSPIKGIQPCHADMDLTVYNRWKLQWNNSPNEPVYLSDDYKY